MHLLKLFSLKDASGRKVRQRGPNIILLLLDSQGVALYSRGVCKCCREPTTELLGAEKLILSQLSSILKLSTVITGIQCRLGRALSIVCRRQLMELLSNNIDIC